MSLKTMEGHPFEISEQMKKIIHTYRKLYTWIFKYGLFVFIVLVATIIALKQTQRFDLQIYEEPKEFLVHKVALKKTFETFISQQVSNPDIDAYIMQGSLQSTGTYFQSNNNLVSYK